MIEQGAANRVCDEAVYLQACADPLRAARTLARAIKIQPRGGRLAFIRTLATILAGDDRTFLADVATELRRP